MDVVAIGVEPQVIHSQYVVSPTAAADALDSELLAFQVFGFLDFRPRHEIALKPADDIADDDDVQSSRGNVQDVVRAGKNRLHIRRRQGRHCQRAGAHEDDFDVEPMLAIKTLVDPDPEYRRIFTAGSVGDAERSQALGVNAAC